MMVALLMAGRQSSSSTSAWIMIRLATRPDIQEELLEELPLSVSPGKIQRQGGLESMVRQAVVVEPALERVIYEISLPSKVQNGTTSARVISSSGETRPGRIIKTRHDSERGRLR